MPASEELQPNIALCTQESPREDGQAECHCSADGMNINSHSWCTVGLSGDTRNIWGRTWTVRCSCITIHEEMYTGEVYGCWRNGGGVSTSD